jgi:hypothetical protein
MDHMKVLRRSLEITWRYRVLWVFGILLALTSGGGGGGNGGARGGSFSPPSGNQGQGAAPFRGFQLPNIPPEVVSTLIAVGIALACVLILLSIASVIVRYVAETALIRMVDDHEETGEKRSIRQGFRWGWSRTSLRLFAIDLLVFVPLVVAFILLLLLALAPLLLWATHSQAAGIVGTVTTIGLVVLFVLVFIVVIAAASLLVHFFRRVCALEEVGVVESIRRGYALVRRHLKDVVVMWLIMVGLTLGWAILMIPVLLLLLLVGVVLAGGPALLVGGLAGMASRGGPLPWLLGGAVGLPIFLLVLTVPMLFLGGLWQIYRSGVWTLTYRELRALEAVQPASPMPTAAE